MSAPDVPFTAADAMVLFDAVTGDEALIGDRVCDWLDDHVHDPQSLHVLLFTLASTLTRLIGVRAGANSSVGVEIENQSGGLVPWSLRMCGQLIGTAANGQDATLAAVIKSVLDQGPGAYTSVLSDMLRLYRGVALSRAAGA